MDAPKSRAFASLPDVAPLVAAAEAAYARGDLESSLEAHKKALLLIPPGDAAARASALASIGEIKRAQGKGREAESNFEKALEAMPGHRRALEALVELATAARDARRVIAYRKKLVAVLDDPRERAAETMRLIDALEGEGGDRKAAVTTLEGAHHALPEDAPILARLRAAHERAGAWGKLFELLGRECSLTGERRARAALRFAQGDVALGRLRKEADGLVAMDQALADDPTHERALQAIEAVRGRRKEWHELARTYEQLIDAFAQRGDAERAFVICVRLAALKRDRLHDGPGAIDAYSGAKKCLPRDVDARAELAELLYASGDIDATVTELEELAIVAPTRVKTYERLSAVHRRTGQLDRAWLAALSLDELGAADVDQQLLLDQFRPEGAIRPGSVLDDAAWDEHLRATDRGGGDEVIAAVMRAVGPAAVAARVDELRAQKRLVALDAARKQSLNSTISIVRTFAWASRVLGIDLPDVYVLDDVPGGLAAAQVATPTIAIGPAVLKGLTIQELAFVAARHLTYYRPEHYPLVFFPTLEEASTLFLAAASIPIGDNATSSRFGGAAAKLRAGIAKHLGEAARQQLADAVGKLEARGGTADLAAWVRAVELTAGRAGLLLAGDLSMAMKRVNGEARGVAGLSAADRRHDLLAYCATRRHAALRDRLQIGAGTPSMLPPAGSLPPRAP